MADRLRSYGWGTVTQIDNDTKVGGGWNDSLLNDATYSAVLRDAKAGVYDAIMVAFPCSTFSVTRLFEVEHDGHNLGSGPPVVRDHDHPDGLPLDQIDAKYHRELRETNILLDRMADICIAARQSVRKATIVWENPADKSVRGRPAHDEALASHGSFFSTSAFSRILTAIGPLRDATFAYCRLAPPPAYQKYTSLYYTPEAASVLDLGIGDGGERAHGGEASHGLTEELGMSRGCDATS